MRPGRERWGPGIALALVLVAVSVARGEDGVASEVRVLSGTDETSAVTVRAFPETRIEDRTTGAQPPQGPRGPASVGQTFSGEISLFLSGVRTPRPVAIEVSDAVVSTVRLFPEPNGTSVVVFVRQPVTYTVSQPSALGEITIDVRTRTQSARTAGTARRGGRPRVIRPKERSDEVAVDAAELSYDQQGDMLIARGGVTLTRGDMTLTADEVRYDKTNSIVDAVGHVVVNDPESVVEGDSIHLSLDDESGYVEAPDLYSPLSGYSMQARHVVKKGGPLYSVTDGVFTTCACGGLERPSWSIKGRQTDVDLAGVGTVRGATLRVKDIPVLYLPWFLFPANNDRQSGLLVPRLGYSKTRGFQYEQPFYWAINKSMDATLGVDYESAARIGALGEFRYRLSRQTRGTFDFAYYNQTIGGITNPGTINGTTASAPENRYVIAADHRQALARGGTFYVDGLGVSDQTILRDIDNYSYLTRGRFAYLRNTRSQVGVFKPWRDGFVQFDNVYDQDLYGPQEFVPERLPRIRAGQQVALADDRLIARVAGEGTEFWRTTGFNGVRGVVAPELFVPFNAGNVVHGSVSGRVQQNGYLLSNGEQLPFVVPDATTATGQFVPAPQLGDIEGGNGRIPTLTRAKGFTYGVVSTRLATEVARVYDFPHLGWGKLRHSIEPEVQYLYVPQTSRPTFLASNLPPCTGAAGERPGNNCGTVFSEGYLFDNLDAINRRNFISYGLTTRIFARGATPEEAAATAAENEAGAGDLESLADEAQADEGEADADDGFGESFGSGLLPQTNPAPRRPRGDDLDPDAEPSADHPGVASDQPSSGSGKAAKAPAPRTRGAASEILRFSILNGYDISRDISESGHVSDVDLGIRLSPTGYLGLNYNTIVNVTTGKVQGQTAGFLVRDPNWQPRPRAAGLQYPTSLALSYSTVGDSQSLYPARSVERALLASPGVDFLQGVAYVRITDFIGLAFLGRYNFKGSLATATQAAQGPGFVERDYLVHIVSRCDCWTLDFGVSDRVNPNETLFRIQLTLVGLGSFGEGSGARRFEAYAPLLGLGSNRGAGAAYW